MNKQSLWKKFKQFIASIGWNLFMWGNETTPEKYWEEIYQQEKAHNEGAGD